MASSLNKKSQSLSNRNGRVEPDLPRQAQAPAETAPRSVGEHKASILIVDDRADKQLAMKTIVADLGENIILASSGREALRHLLQREFAVILLDVNMPGMDGFETAHLIRQRKSLENLPIIFVSAVNDTETHVSRGYSLGAVDYILAPIVPEILRTKVAVFVDLFKITDQVRRQAEDLRLARSELEKRVQQRTQELAVANQSLQVQIAERLRAEENLRELNTKLEQRVADRTLELSTANQELETFSYSIAHDLRAPFRQIAGYAEILREDFASNLPTEAQSYLNRIRVRSKEMERMVDDLLRLFMFAKQPFTFEPISLNDIASEVIAHHKATNPDRAIEWHVDILPAAVGNAALIRQVFENLLSNAVKYSRPRHPARIEIGQMKIASETVIYVRDNGVGFDMEDAGRLFGVFQRLHREEEFEGTGVGLALVARIIRRHNGRVWAEGKADQGATIYFTLGGKRS